MSLEEALALNSAALDRNTDMLGRHLLALESAPKPKAKTSRKKKVAEPTPEEVHQAAVDKAAKEALVEEPAIKPQAASAPTTAEIVAVVPESISNPTFEQLTAQAAEDDLVATNAAVAPPTQPSAAPLTTAAAPVTAAAAPVGSVPVSDASPYRQYCMKLCQALSTETGDPAATIALATSLGVANLATSDDQALVPLVESLTAKLTEMGKLPEA